LIWGEEEEEEEEEEEKKKRKETNKSLQKVVAASTRVPRNASNTFVHLQCFILALLALDSIFRVFRFPASSL
jgi:hypothetical protein